MWSMLIPLALILGTMLVPLGIVYGVRYGIKRKKRRSPLKDNFLRSPGESLREKIDALTEDILFYLAFMPVVPLAVYSIHVSQSYFGGTPETASRTIGSILLGLAMTLYFAVKLVKLLESRRKFRLGYEAELATGQELNALMLDGFRVYHDFPAEGFNIDHIVVGPCGVFAVETKGRAKPTTGNGMADAQIIYDGESLRFPKWVETKPLEQAKSQAEWLRKWLSSATGESVGVQPVLSLPGWFVKRTSPSGIPVLNPKLFASYVKKARGSAMVQAQINRIVHQLDQRCRNVAPREYGQSREGK